MGLVGFSHTLAMEGAKYNILSNVIVPIAYSRMSATVMDPGKPHTVCVCLVNVLLCMD